MSPRKISGSIAPATYERQLLKLRFRSPLALYWECINNEKSLSPPQLLKKNPSTRGNLFEVTEPLQTTVAVYSWHGENIVARWRSVNSIVYIYGAHDSPHSQKREVQDIRLKCNRVLAFHKWLISEADSQKNYEATLWRLGVGISPGLPSTDSGTSFYPTA